MDLATGRGPGGAGNCDHADMLAACPGSGAGACKGGAERLALSEHAHPGSNKVGDAACLGCHAKKGTSYRLHPIGRAGSPSRQSPRRRSREAAAQSSSKPTASSTRSRIGEVNGQDMTIVNPDSLEPSLRDAVCEQCHLNGHQRVLRLDRRNEDYRPGLPFHEFWTVLDTVGGAAEQRFVGQVEQMHESRCFRASKGALGCTSCHDPHRLPEPGEQVAYYRRRCLECHADQGCSLATAVRLERSRDDDCVSCHMPSARSSDVIHAATTDHRILRHASQPDRAPAAGGQPSGGQGHMVVFHRDLMDEHERAEAQRDVGVGLAVCYEWPESAAAALPLLEAALLGRPDDVTAWESKGIVLGRLGRREEALAAFRTALAQEPNRESTLLCGGVPGRVCGATRGRHRLLAPGIIAINPWRELYHAELANLLSQVRDWLGAVDESLRRHPPEPRPSSNASAPRPVRTPSQIPRGLCKEFQTLLGFEPPNRDELIRWFASLVPDQGGRP